MNEHTIIKAADNTNASGALIGLSGWAASVNWIGWAGQRRECGSVFFRGALNRPATPYCLGKPASECSVMSLDVFFDYLIAAFGAVLGWFVKIGHEAHKELAKEVTMCVKKDDFRDIIDRIERRQEDQFNRILNRLDAQDTKLDAIRDTLANKADRRELLTQRGVDLP